MRKMVLALSVVSMSLVLATMMACQTVGIDPIPDDIGSIPGDKIGMVLMHGKGGETSLIFPLGWTLRRKGILVEMPLMPWSEDRIYDKGYEESMAEIDTYVARLKAAGAKRIVVGGHSLGANVALGYAARREGLSGVILLAYGHVPGESGLLRRLSGSVSKARSMIGAGKGDQLAVFTDHGGTRAKVKSTANDLLSWFDPNGPAVIKNIAPKVKPNTPVLCVHGSGDKRNRCRKIMELVPMNPMNRYVMVSANHQRTPRAAVEHVAVWLRELN